MWASACRAPQGGGTLVSTGQGQASPQAPAEGDQGTGGAGRRAPLGDRDGARPGAPSVCRGGRRGGLCSDQELSSHQESYHRGVHSSEPPLPGLSAERLSNWPRVTRPLSAAGSYDGKNAGLPQGSYVRISALPVSLSMAWSGNNDRDRERGESRYARCWRRADPQHLGSSLVRVRGRCPWVPGLAPTCSRMPSRCHSISGAGSASTEHSRTSCPGARPTTERGPRGPIMCGGAGGGQRRHERWTHPCRSHPASVPCPYSDTPTLNPDPEALFDFASRTLGQASVQPSIAHLGMEQVSSCLWPSPAHLLSWFPSFTAKAPAEPGIPLFSQPIPFSGMFLLYFCLTLALGLGQSLPPAGSPRGLHQPSSGWAVSYLVSASALAQT